MIQAPSAGGRRPRLTLGVVRGLASAATRGVTRWGRKFRVRVWLPGTPGKPGQPRRAGRYRHIGLYPTLDEAIRVSREKRRELLACAV